MEKGWQAEIWAIRRFVAEVAAHTLNSATLEEIRTRYREESRVADTETERLNLENVAEITAIAIQQQAKSQGRD